MLRPRHNGWHFAENCGYVCECPVIDKSTFDQVMAWHLWTNKPSPEPMLTKILDAISHHYSQGVNSLWPSVHDTMINWRHWSGPTLAQIMACCLMLPSHYLNWCWFIIKGVLWHYFQTPNISCTSVGNKTVDHSDVVGASSIGAAPITSSFFTENLASIEWAKATARWDKKHLSFRIWCASY